MTSYYNSSERFIAQILKKLPFIKNIIKYYYARIVFYRHKKRYNYKTKYNISLLFDFIPDCESFFGYYDKKPVNKNGFLLTHLTSHNTVSLPHKNTAITLAVFSQHDSSPIWKSHVSAYNWQQGCRGHWLNDNFFIFNDFDPSKKIYISHVISIKNFQEIKKFNFPAQDSFGTDFFLSVNYQRLMSLSPDYGYRNLPQLHNDSLKKVENDGIWKIDFLSEKACLLVCLKAVVNFEWKPIFLSSFHSINHVTISPNGRKFIFIHRFYHKKQRFDRLFLADSQSGKLLLLADYGMASHFFWADNDTLLGYLKSPQGKNGYWLINIHTGQFSSCANGKLNKYGDGHPHVHGDWFITDTYPDKAQMQHLILCNWKTGNIIELGEFFHGFKYQGECRCDLHPRFSHEGKTVFFDSVFDGQRRIYQMDISHIIGNG